MTELEEDLEMLSDGFGHVTIESKTRNALFEHGPHALLVTATMGEGLLNLEVRAYVGGERQVHPNGAEVWALCLQADTN